MQDPEKGLTVQRLRLRAIAVLIRQSEKRQEYGMSLISVIIPVYQAEKELPGCIDSILAQTFRDFELILVDDGSRDASPAVCDSYAARDSRIRVIHQANAGQAAARNAGLAAASGEWIHFVDNDDHLHPQMLSHLLEAVRKSGAGMAASGIVEGSCVPPDFGKPASGDFLCHDVTEDYLADLYLRDDKLYWVCFAKLIRSDLIREIPFPTGDIFEDNAVICQWLCRCGRIAVVEAPLYFYYVNPKGITKSTFSPRQLGWLRALTVQRDFYQASGYEKMLSLICTRYVRDAAYSCLRVRHELKDPALARRLTKECRDFIRDNRDHIRLSREEWKQVNIRLSPALDRLHALRIRLRSPLCAIIPPHEPD